MIVAEDFRLRADPGPEYPWHFRLFWQHVDTPVFDCDLKAWKNRVGDIHDAYAIANA